MSKASTKLLFLIGFGIFLGMAKELYAGWGTFTLYIKPGRIMQFQWATETGKTYDLQRLEGGTWITKKTNINPGDVDTTIGPSDRECQYQIIRKPDGVESDNSPRGWADSTPPTEISVFDVTSWPQSPYGTLTWGIPGDTNKDKNGGQFYFKLYRKESSRPFCSSDNPPDESDLIAVIKAPKPYDTGQSFSCIDGGTTIENSIRNPSWGYFSWVKENSEPKRGTQYTYVVKVVDQAGVWIVWDDYYPIATDSAVSGNQSPIVKFNSNQSMLITPIDDLSASGVIDQGIRLNWTAATQTLGTGYYFEIYRSTMTLTGQGTLTQGSITTSGPSNPYYIGQTNTLTYLDTTGVQGTYRYSYAVLIYDPHADGGSGVSERSPLSNDCTILADWKAPDIANIYPTTDNPAYQKGTGTLIVEFTYTEANPQTCTVAIEGTAFSTTTTLPDTPLPGGTDKPGSATLVFKDLVDGAATITVTIIDKSGNQSTCTSPSSLIIDNVPPTVNAGPDVTTNTTFIQDATTSDVGSGIATWAWTAPANVVFSNPAIEDPIISATVDGTYVATLTVTDN
ncbi:TPA: hypothetical protein DCX16_05715, partial [bacterium]|nr:hypothetical protein [bacterium]